MKFNIGDNVYVARKSSNWSAGMEHWLGQIMTVQRYICGMYEMVEDTNENFGCGWTWAEEDLDPVERITIIRHGDEIYAKHNMSLNHIHMVDSDFKHGTKEAIEKLFEMRKTIAVGDTVKVIDSGRIYDLYVDWVIKNVGNAEKIAMYQYGRPIDCDSTYKTYEVIKIAPHSKEFNNTKLAYIQASNGMCFLIGIDGIEKV